MQRKRYFEMNKAFWLITVWFVLMGSAVMNISVCAATSGNYTYTLLDDQTVMITGYSGDATVLTIPEMIDGKPVTGIGDFAFDKCSSLTEITIPESVARIGNCAFGNCSNLKEITIPENVTSIGSNAFYFCIKLDTITVAEGNTVYDSRDGCNAVIETTKNSLIAGCQTTVVPSTVTRIDYGAFWGCSGLTEITIPESVTIIEGGAFRGCSGLTEITLPKSGRVTVYGGAFSGCSGLTEITIPENVYFADANAFEECENLTTIMVEEGNTYFDSRNGCNAIIEKETNKLITGCQTTVIPNTVTSIGRSAFKGCSRLTEIVIPESVTSIDDSVFSYCLGLTKIVIPESVTSIGDFAFYGCSGLTEIVLPESVTSIGDVAFSGCSGLTEITIPKSVTSIGDMAFNGCDADLIIMTADGSAAAEYAEANNIKHATPHNHMGGTATCTEKAVCDICGFNYGEKAPNNHGGEAFVRDAVTPTISGEGYTGDIYCSACWRLLSLGTTIPALSPGDVGSSGETAISNTPEGSVQPNETTLSIDNSGQTGTETVIGAAETDSQAAEKSVVIYAPSKAPQLGEVFEVYGIQYKITSLDKKTVSCVGLAAANTGSIRLVIPQKIQIDSTVYTIAKIEPGAFANDARIRTVTVGDGVTEIADSAFENVAGIESLTLGAGVQSIGSKAFYNCKKLKNVTIHSGKLKCIGKAAFKNTGKYSLSAGKNVLPAYKKLIKNSGKEKSMIVSNLFYQVVNEKKKTVRCTGGAKKMTKVSIPSKITSDGTKYKVTEIGNAAFKNDKKVTQINIKSVYLTTIGNSAFQNCKNLKKLTIKSTKLKKVGKNAFKGCRMDVAVPEKMTDKYTKLFKGKW